MNLSVETRETAKDRGRGIAKPFARRRPARVPRPGIGKLEDALGVCARAGIDVLLLYLPEYGAWAAELTFTTSDGYAAVGASGGNSAGTAYRRAAEKYVAVATTDGRLRAVYRKK